MTGSAGRAPGRRPRRVVGEPPDPGDRNGVSRRSQLPGRLQAHRGPPTRSRASTASLVPFEALRLAAVVLVRIALTPTSGQSDDAPVDAARQDAGIAEDGLDVGERHSVAAVASKRALGEAAHHFLDIRRASAVRGLDRPRGRTVPEGERPAVERDEPAAAVGIGQRDLDRLVDSARARGQGLLDVFRPVGGEAGLATRMRRARPRRRMTRSCALGRPWMKAMSKFSKTRSTVRFSSTSSNVTSGWARWNRITRG